MTEKTNTKTSFTTKLIRRSEDWLLSKLIERCPHEDRHVSEDLLEGCMNKGYTKLHWCRRCGSVRFAHGLRYQEWRQPRPLWCSSPSFRPLSNKPAIKNNVLNAP